MKKVRSTSARAVARVSAPLVPSELKELEEQIGSFLEYWGFKKIHGRVWLHLYLSEKPLAVVDLMKRLKVSKALMSFCINEMLEYRVIEEAGQGRYGTVLYVANPDLLGIISHVLRGRELAMMTRIFGAFKNLRETSSRKKSELAHFALDDARIRQMGELIHSAERALKTVIQVLGESTQSGTKNGARELVEILDFLTEFAG